MTASPKANIKRPKPECFEAYHLARGGKPDTAKLLHCKVQEHMSFGAKQRRDKGRSRSAAILSILSNSPLSSKASPKGDA